VNTESAATHRERRDVNTETACVNGKIAGVNTQIVCRERLDGSRTRH
jgi:hypothetical protein